MRTRANSLVLAVLLTTLPSVASHRATSDSSSPAPLGTPLDASPNETKTIVSKTITVLDERSRGDYEQVWNSYNNDGLDEMSFDSSRAMLAATNGLVASPLQTEVTGVDWFSSTRNGVQQVTAVAQYRSRSLSGGVLCGSVTWRQDANDTYSISQVKNFVALRDERAKSVKMTPKNAEALSKACAGEDH